MNDRLGEFLTMLADNHGAGVFRPYNPDRADAYLDSFKAELTKIYTYEAAGLLKTGRTRAADYLPFHPTRMIEVALTQEGADRWRSP